MPPPSASVPALLSMLAACSSLIGVDSVLPVAAFSMPPVRLNVPPPIANPLPVIATLLRL